MRSKHDRTKRTACVGVALWVASFLMDSHLEANADSNGARMGQDVDQLVSMLGFQLLVGLLLVSTFLVGSLLMVRTMRRLRKLILRKRATPTQSEDVWVMHKLPDGALDFDPTEGYA